MKMLALRNRPLPSFSEIDSAGAIVRVVSALELSAAIAHGRYSRAVRGVVRRYAAIGRGLVATRNRSVPALRVAAARCGAGLAAAAGAVHRTARSIVVFVGRTMQRSAVFSGRTVYQSVMFAANSMHRSAVLIGSAAHRSGVVTARRSIAVVSFTAEHAQRASAAAGPHARRVTGFTARHVRAAGATTGRWLRKFAGTQPAEEVAELELSDLVPLEYHLLAGIGTPPLPTFDMVTSNDLELDFATENGDDRASEVCSPAVVRLAKLSGREARVDCSPISMTASTWRPVRVSRARFGTRG